jgi:hypothetical protein
MRLGASLLTACIDCRHVPGLSACVAAKRSMIHSSRTIDADTANQVIDLLGEQRHCFAVESIAGSMICLRRRKKSTCPVCRREHSSSSPFIVVRSDRSVWYHCRRDESSGPLCLGYASHRDTDTDESPLAALSPQPPIETAKELSVSSCFLHAARSHVLPDDVSKAIDSAKRREYRKTKKARCAQDRAFRTSVLSRLEARLNSNDSSPLR